ncbi:unnamed protein product [Prunus brigantina]
MEAISGESFRYQKRFPTCANGKPGDFLCCERQIRQFPYRSVLSLHFLLYFMSNSESYPEREPNAFEGESSDGLFDSDNEAVGPDAEDGSDTDVEIIGEGSQSVPSHGIGKGLMIAPVPLSIVYSDGRRVGLAAPGESSAGHQSEPSTSGRGASSAEPSSRPRVSVVFPSNDRVPMGVPKEHVFGVDYLEPNRITEREIAKYRAKYFIPDSVRIRIPGPKETLSRPKEGEVVFFMDVLQQGCADHGGWVQANYLKATERGHFISCVPTSQKTWRKRRVILSGDWESPSGHPIRFHIPTTFQIAGRRLLYRSVGYMTEEKRAAEAKRMNESSKGRLMMGLQGRKKKGRQPEAVPVPSEGVDVDNQTLYERLQRLDSDSAPPRSAAAVPSPGRGVSSEGTSSRAASKRPFTVDLDAEPATKRGRQADGARAIFAAEDDDAPADPVTLACPSKTFQFANHMILGSQMELSEIEDLPKKQGGWPCLPFSSFGKTSLFWVLLPFGLGLV